MLVLSAKTGHAHEQGAFAHLYFVVQGEQATDKYVQKMSEQFGINLAAIMETQNFTGKNGDLLLLPVTKDGSVRLLIFAGIGKKDSSLRSFELYRRALASAIKKAQAARATTISVQLPDHNHFGVNVDHLAYNSAIIAKMSAYCFDEFIAQETRDECVDLVEIMFCALTDDAVVGDAVARGAIVAQSVNKARHWIDLPPSKLTPPHLADYAQEIVNEHDNLSMTMFGEDEVIKMGMGGLAGVSKGSDVDCRLVLIEYNCGNPQAETLAFVGKGITFDSGGLSLKPPRFMETMKEDMSGAAAVLATMQAVAQLKPNVNIIGVTPLSENVPSGKATKPGDIITFYNGKTAEVKNTDAEGCLVLADALSYVVQHHKPAMIIDLATLTGACAYALGPFYTGLFSLHDELADKIKASGDRSGDYVWRLPMTDDYKKAIKSPVADICNIGNSKIQAGATTAAHFLQNFVGDTPWVHLDIAGTAFDVPDISYYRTGATGVGVRLLVDLAMNWKK